MQGKYATAKTCLRQGKDYGRVAPFKKRMWLQYGLSIPLGVRGGKIALHDLIRTAPSRAGLKQLFRRDQRPVIGMIASKYIVRLIEDDGNRIMLFFAKRMMLRKPWTSQLSSTGITSKGTTIRTFSYKPRLLHQV